MAYRVEFTKSAEKAFDRLDPASRKRIAVEITRLGENPRHPGIIKLESEHDLYRVRVGSYRIVFSIEDDKLIVLVVKIGHRREIYR